MFKISTVIAEVNKVNYHRFVNVLTLLHLEMLRILKYSLLFFFDVFKRPLCANFQLSKNLT